MRVYYIRVIMTEIYWCILNCGWFLQMMTEKQRKCLTNPHFYCDGEITSGNYTLRNSAMQIVRLMLGWNEINMMMNVFVACLIYEGQQGCNTNYICLLQKMDIILVHESLNWDWKSMHWALVLVEGWVTLPCGNFIKQLVEVMLLIKQSTWLGGEAMRWNSWDRATYD